METEHKYPLYSDQVSPDKCETEHLDSKFWHGSLYSYSALHEDGEICFLLVVVTLYTLSNITSSQGNETEGTFSA